MDIVNYTPTATGPADFGWEVTPDDDNDLDRVTRQLRVGTDGVVKWHNMGGEVQHTTILTGERVAIKARRILATGTTATGIEALA